MRICPRCDCVLDPGVTTCPQCLFDDVPLATHAWVSAPSAPVTTPSAPASLPGVPIGAYGPAVWQHRRFPVGGGWWTQVYFALLLCFAIFCSVSTVWLVLGDTPGALPVTNQNVTAIPAYPAQTNPNPAPSAGPSGPYVLLIKPGPSPSPTDTPMPMPGVDPSVEMRARGLDAPGAGPFEAIVDALAQEIRNSKGNQKSLSAIDERLKIMEHQLAMEIPPAAVIDGLTYYNDPKLDSLEYLRSAIRSARTKPPIIQSGPIRSYDELGYAIFAANRADQQAATGSQRHTSN